MITYAVELSGQKDLLGRSLGDRAKIDSFRLRGNLEDTILSFITNSRPTNKEERLREERKITELYHKKIYHMMSIHEQECSPDDFYLGYLTVLDFFIYEIMNYFHLLFPKEMAKFPKLNQIQERVAALPQIEDYENSHRKVTEYCPNRYFRKFKESKLKTKVTTIRCVLCATLEGVKLTEELNLY